jgi:hypothetical protein
MGLADMTDDNPAFSKELHGKVYLLVNGAIDFEDFKAWYRLAIVASAPSAKVASIGPSDTEATAQALGYAPFIPPPKTERFTDYVRDIDQPDEATRAHHRRLLGSGSED